MALIVIEEVLYCWVLRKTQIVVHIKFYKKTKICLLVCVCEPCTLCHTIFTLKVVVNRNDVLYNQNFTYGLFCWGSIICDVCLNASTHDLRSFLIFSLSSGQSFDWPTCINKSRNKAIWLLISTINCKEREDKLISLQSIWHD